VTFTGGAGTGVSQGLVANADGEVVCEICAFLAAGGVIEAWMFSEPRYLGQIAVGADGTFSGVAPLGDLEEGEHTLQVNGSTVRGSQRSAMYHARSVVTYTLPVPAGAHGPASTS
jgi:hypothetical protein